MFFKKPSVIKTGLLCLVIFGVFMGCNYFWSSMPINESDEHLIEEALNKPSVLANSKLHLYVDRAMADGIVTKGELSRIKKVAKKEGRI